MTVRKEALDIVIRATHDMLEDNVDLDQDIYTFLRTGYEEVSDEVESEHSYLVTVMTNFFLEDLIDQDELHLFEHQEDISISDVIFRHEKRIRKDNLVLAFSE